jgi:hypothetical protein
MILPSRRVTLASTVPTFIEDEKSPPTYSQLPLHILVLVTSLALPNRFCVTGNPHVISKMQPSSS